VKSPVFQWVCATDNGSRRFTEIRPGRGARGRKRKSCHKPRGTGAASGGIRAFADIVAERIDAKGAVLENDDACHPRNEECTKGRDPAASGEAQDRWKHENDRHGDQVDVAILPHDERIFLQVV
jgi:hypothetical protein